MRSPASRRRTAATSISRTRPISKGRTMLRRCSAPPLKVRRAMRMARLTFSGGAEQRRNIVLPFDIGLVREIEVAAVRLRLAGERIAQTLLCFRTLQSHGGLLSGNVNVPPRGSGTSEPYRVGATTAIALPQSFAL